MRVAGGEEERSILICFIRGRTFLPVAGTFVEGAAGGKEEVRMHLSMKSLVVIVLVVLGPAQLV
jgi:hypothetical protein